MPDRYDAGRVIDSGDFGAMESLVDDLLKENERDGELAQQAIDERENRIAMLQTALRWLLEGADRQVGGFDALDEMDVARNILNKKGTKAMDELAGALASAADCMDRAVELLEQRENNGEDVNEMLADAEKVRGLLKQMLKQV